MVLLLLALACSPDKPGGGGGVEDDTGTSGDCGDTGSVEVCNGVDDDCDGRIDEDAVDATDWYPDADGDGHGDPSAAVTACEPPDGYIAVAGDCDDADPVRNTGATEVCDDADVDEDCDGQADDDDPDAEGRVTWYQDLDGDGHGTGVAWLACDPPDHSASVDDDCDDTRTDVFPGAVEVCEDDVDQDCDGDDALCVDDRLVTLGDDEADLVWYGPNAYDLFGRAFHGGQDVDGDGVADLVMGNSLARVGDERYRGAVYLGVGGREGRHSAGDAELVIEGDTYLGVDVALLPARDGGAGAIAASGYEDDGGCAVWRFDVPEGGAWPSDPLTTADADGVLEGDASAACFGREVALLSDHDGDGAGDLAITASGAAEAVGVVRVYRAGWPLDVDADSLQLRGAVDAAVPWRLVEVPDVDGDGCDELAFIEDGYTEETLWLAMHSACDDGVIVPGDLDRRWDLSGAGTMFAGGLAGLGDSDGDGFGDLAIGLPGRETGSAVGWVTVLHGPIAASGDIEDVPDRIEGDGEPVAFFGGAVLGPGDLDGDGRGDLLVGDELYEEDYLDVGAVFLFTGDVDGVRLQSSHARRWANQDNEGLQGGHMLEPFGDRRFLAGAISDSASLDHAGALFLFEVGAGL